MSLAKAIKAVGGPAELARRLGVTVQAVSQWKKVPPGRVLAVERASGIRRSDLRPDLYPPEAPSTYPADEAVPALHGAPQ